ncbi:LptF/LptG family permease [Coraliomargarita parva]|uniref:LptF/LptG family permease n=1 Tax=Coraliomargarita parva TaxID=3014050 RepID=UPI0022B48102|nr:LptF/LptG family permease [Coraliomargarita parva]
MLKLLHRHVLKEILVSTGLAMFLFVFVLLLGNVIREIAGLVAAGKLGFMVFLKLVGLLIPYVASYALPLGMLTGTLMALGRLSSQREITAMKSVGVSLYRLASPVFLIAFIGMVAAVLINLQFAPRAVVLRKQIMASAVSDNPVGFIEEKRFISEFPGYIIYLGGRDGKVMKDFWIWELDEQQRVHLFVRAAEGELQYNPGDSSLVLVLKNGTAEQRSSKNPEDFGSEPPDSVFFEQTSIALPLDQLFGESKKRRTRVSEMTFSQLMQARDVALQEEAETGESMSKQRMKVQMHLQENLAMAFSVFSLSIFGVPLAIQVGRKETYANLAIALVIALSYYFLMIMVSWLENYRGMRPDLLVWLPNIIFQGIALYLFQRANRH